MRGAATVGRAVRLADRDLSAQAIRPLYSEMVSTTLPRAWPCSR
jgi:hypothetical protein